MALAATGTRQRIASLDLVRGVVMVLMAIDHVRVYSGVPAGGPSAGIFLTRWVTHFCAPAFVFLAGTSAFLYGRTIDNKSALARYLVSRGALLILLELTVIRFSWTFNVDYSSFLLAGVIWMLGWCMILLAALIWLPLWAIGTIGLAIMAGQDLLHMVPRVLPGALQSVWGFIYVGGQGGPITLGHGGPEVTVLYTIVPWIGVMAAGYAFGAIVTRDAASRRRLCLTIGLSATLLFLVFGVISTLMSSPPTATPLNGPPPFWLRLLNQRKYPASQLYLLMTLGPTITLLALVDEAKGAIARFFETFGRVPMFYYLLHIPLIHAIALLVWRLRDGSVNTNWFNTAPYVSVPPNARWSLLLLYVVFVIVVAILYVPCRWFAGVKRRRQDAWLRFL
jgi:uncharacterized membrane protein